MTLALRLVTAPADAPTRTLAAVLLVLMCLAGFAFPQFLSPTYLVQQLHSGAFLGIVATGAMVVILTGHIDLSVPWTLSAAATFSTAFVGSAGGSAWGELGLPIGLLIGVGIGAVNGIGVGYLRVPSMIWTLAVNMVVFGVCVYHTGLYASASAPSRLVLVLGADRTMGIPNAALVWIAVSLGAAVLLRRTVLGRRIHAVGTAEAAAYLSGVDTRRVILAAFVVSGACSALAGMLLAGYAGQAYQNMGDPYLLPGIAAVVLGGTSILGGRGRLSGTVCGVLLVTLISSTLSVMQVGEAWRQIAYGLVIVAMVGLYSRAETRTFT